MTNICYCWGLNFLGLFERPELFLAVVFSALLSWVAPLPPPCSSNRMKLSRNKQEVQLLGHVVFCTLLYLFPLCLKWPKEKHSGSWKSRCDRTHWHQMFQSTGRAGKMKAWLYFNGCCVRYTENGAGYWHLVSGSKSKLGFIVAAQLTSDWTMRQEVDTWW